MPTDQPPAELPHDGPDAADPAPREVTIETLASDLPTPPAPPGPLEDGEAASCDRCDRRWRTTTDDQLHTVTPPVGDGHVCEPCLLDLLDLSRGIPARSGRDL